MVASATIPIAIQFRKRDQHQYVSECKGKVRRRPEYRVVSRRTPLFGCLARGLVLTTRGCNSR